jgi:hypothetical protein
VSVLSACQSAMMRLVKYRPQSVFSSNDPTVQEIADLVNEVATFIMKKHDWQALTAIGQFVGDDVTRSFPKPADYDRMVQGSEIQDNITWFWNFVHTPTIDEWITLKNSNWNLISPGAWILLGDEFQFNPPPPSTQLAEFPYIKNTYARSNTNQPKAQFDADTDTFVLNERLLTLGLVWMWRQQKRLDSGQEEVDFMTALSEEASRDGGARTIRHTAFRRLNTSIGWPGRLG